MVILYGINESHTRETTMAIQVISIGLEMNNWP